MPTSGASPCRFPVETRDRQLLDDRGEPFVWLGDTAWELVHRLDHDAITHYADVRQRQEFTVVQFVLLAELDGLNTPNPRGHRPLRENDPTDPDPGYFEDVDFAVKTLNDRGLVACLLPTWGDKFNRKWGIGPEVFTPDNAAVYGDWLGDRYKNAAVVWMLGGDRSCADDEDRAIMASLAAGLANGHEGRHLHTYHPSGGSTSVDALGSDPAWIDFHCIQSGHAANADPAGLVKKALSQTQKPVLQAEPAYEDHPKMTPDWSGSDGYWSEAEVFAGLKASLEAGAFGVTYGCHPVWQMYDPAKGREPVNGARRSWREALELPVAERVRTLRG